MSSNWCATLPPDVGVVVVAAGRGIRAGGAEPKQFRIVAGAPLVLHAVRLFLRHPHVGTLVLVVPPEVADSPPSWLAELAGDRLLLAAGGAERQDSARAGLAALPATCRIVMVHDGARPLPDPDVTDAIIEHAREGRGAIAAIPLSDTVKEADASGSIVRTVSRERLWRAQTPQGFPRALLERAFAAAAGAPPATDEATLVEQVGGTVVIVPDTSRNLKVTTAEDFALAEILLRDAR